VSLLLLEFRVGCMRVRPTILEKAFGETTGQIGTMFVQAW